MTRHVKVCIAWWAAVLVLLGAAAVTVYAAATGSIKIAGTVSGLDDGSVTVGPISMTTSSAVYQRTTLSLASGNNTISVPAGATICILIFPADNTNAVKIKGASGDTGVTLNKVGKCVLQLDSGQTTFILNAADTTAGTIAIFM
jgi:hypothetical protein